MILINIINENKLKEIRKCKQFALIVKMVRDITQKMGRTHKIHI